MTIVNNSAPQPLELKIYSLPFRLRAPEEEHERLERAARHVDTTMRELVAANPSADTTRLAIQAAFLIATDLFRSLDEGFAGGTPPAQFARRVEEMLTGLDKALAEMKSVLPPPAETFPVQPYEEPAPEQDLLPDNPPDLNPIPAQTDDTQPKETL